MTRKINSVSAIVLAVLASINFSPVSADSLKGTVKSSTASTKTYLKKHPNVKKVAVGAGVGAGAGALTGLVTGKGVLRGAAIGTAAGGGVGLIKSSKTLKQHPIAEKVAEGAVIGLGLGLAGSGGHNSSKNALAAGGLGAAVGLGAGLLKNELKK